MKARPRTRTEQFIPKSSRSTYDILPLTITQKSKAITFFALYGAIEESTSEITNHHTDGFRTQFSRLKNRKKQKTGIPYAIIDIAYQVRIYQVCKWTRFRADIIEKSRNPMRKSRKPPICGAIFIARVWKSRNRNRRSRNRRFMDAVSRLLYYERYSRTEEYTKPETKSFLRNRNRSSRNRTARRTKVEECKNHELVKQCFGQNMSREW